MNNPDMRVMPAASGAEGEGAAVSRLFPLRHFMNFDPFVLWDEFSLRPGAGFPDHPHRGFEGITYLLQGSINHRDNLGNNATVHGGGLQRFTAGRGIIHSEMPSTSAETRGIQLWVNLPVELKTLAPAYQQVDADAIKQLEISGGRVRLLCGEGALLKLHSKVIYQDVELQAGHRYCPDIDTLMRGFVYVLSGALTVDGVMVARAHACFIENRERLTIEAGIDARFMLCFGVPHNQAINQHGSYVD